MFTCTFLAFWSYLYRLSKQYRRIQSEVKYLGHIYSAVCKHFFNAIDHMDYYPSKHVTPNPQSSNCINCWGSRRRACSSCKARQYFDLSTDEIKYLCKVNVALQKVNKKPCHNVTKTHQMVNLKKGLGSPHSRQKWFSLLT